MVPVALVITVWDSIDWILMVSHNTKYKYFHITNTNIGMPGTGMPKLFRVCINANLCILYPNFPGRTPFPKACCISGTHFKFCNILAIVSGPLFLRQHPILQKLLHARTLFSKFLAQSLFACMNIRADSRFAPSQWETELLCNDVSLWLGASLESTLWISIKYYMK